MILEGKTILVTGGVGSFGQKFTEVVLKNLNPKSIRIYDHNELGGVEMERKFKDDRLRLFIGDIRDKERLQRAMNGVDIVVHAAALKHVPVCEYNPLEAVRTNIEGTANVIDAAINNNIERAIEISTDKAVHPVNLYGATKMVAEKLFVQANSYVGENRRTKFSCTRYGNVVGSSGSVIPLFKKQKEEGEITITDVRMSRFWITLNQGVNFVIQALDRMTGGEIFVPKIPSMKLVELAQAVAPEAKQKIIGMRPGEKLHEVLLTPEEAGHSKEFKECYVIEPEFVFWSEQWGIEGGNEMPFGFSYSSDTNTWWLTKEEMAKMGQSSLNYEQEYPIRASMDPAR